MKNATRGCFLKADTLRLERMQNIFNRPEHR
jgi:hypothetical protein